MSEGVPRLGITPAHALLLRAALAPPEEALAAWRSWERAFGLDGVDPGSFRLLPLVASNLAREPGVDGRLKGIHRQSWYRNQLLLRGLDPALDALASAGVPAILLKGVPLAFGVYPDAGSRPMQDADILVPPERAAAAREALAVCGLAPLAGLARWPPLNQPAWPFVDAAGREIDVHVYAMAEGRHAGADDGFRARARAVPIQGRRRLVLAPGDQLLHVLVHGSWWSRAPGVRFVADAALLLRRGGIDWDAFVTECAQRRLALAVREALAAVAFLTGEEVPGPVAARLESIPVSAWERAEQEARTRAPGALLGALPRLVVATTRTRPPGAPVSWRSWPDRLAEHWGVRPGWPLVRAALVKVVARARPGRAAPRC